ncbi:MAG TPA: hypothetical protein VLJ10_01925, partial [Candidatus Bathyarchaeia archaeon]|nr:hypothetical protein [Candidatus Bathyarchaeia archaeon]
REVITRAKKILTRLELHQDLKGSLSSDTAAGKTNEQIDFFLLPGDPLAQEIKDEIVSLNLETMTPMEAMNKLNELKEKVKSEK